MTEKQMAYDRRKYTQVEVDTKLLSEKMDSIAGQIKELSIKMETFNELYVTKEDFSPVKQLVYGMVAIILIAVVTSLIALVIKQPLH